MSDSSEQMTDVEFEAAAKATQVTDSVKAGAYMVLVEGKKAPQAGKAINKPRQTIYAAVKAIRKAHDQFIAPEGCRRVEVWLPDELADKIEPMCRLRGKLGKGS